jgi:hypothetical protein
LATPLLPNISNTLHRTPPSILRLQYSNNPTKRYEGGGRNKSSTIPSSSQQPLQQPIYPAFTIQKGPLKIARISISSITDIAWQPDHNLPQSCDLHPLLTFISPQTLTELQAYCQQPPHIVVAFSAYRPTMVLETYALRNLISHNKFINDEVVNLFLGILCHQHNFSFLSPSFLTVLS